jgi:sporulation protein YlmC with PRC-barrel domain
VERRGVARQDADRPNGEQIGKLQDVDVDLETDEPQFGTA